MALVIARAPGEAFFVGDMRFVVVEVVDHSEQLNSFWLENAQGERILISDRKSVEILPHVHVSAGDRQQPRLARIAIDAPRSIPITRE